MDCDFDSLSADEFFLLNKVLRAYRNNVKYGEARWVVLTPMCADDRPDAPILIPQKPKPAAGEAEKVNPRKEGDWDTKTPPSVPTPRISDNGVSVDLDLGTTCREAIRAILVLEKRRMTSGEIYQWLKDHTKSYTKPTVIKTLSLMQDGGEIDNDKDDYGKGYGLCVWAKGHGVIDT